MNLLVKHRKANVAERIKLKIQRLETEQGQRLDIVSNKLGSKEEAIVLFVRVLAGDVLTPEYSQVAHILREAGEVSKQIAELKMLKIAYDQAPEEFLELDLSTADWLMV